MREYAGVCGSMRGRAGGRIQEYVGVCGNAIFDLKSMREYAEAFGRKPAKLYLKRKYLSDNYKEMKSYYWEARARSEGQMMLEVFWFKNSRDQNPSGNLQTLPTLHPLNASYRPCSYRPCSYRCCSYRCCSYRCCSYRPCPSPPSGSTCPTRIGGARIGSSLPNRKGWNVRRCGRPRNFYPAFAGALPSLPSESIRARCHLLGCSTKMKTRILVLRDVPLTCGGASAAGGVPAGSWAVRGIFFRPILTPP